MTGRIRSAKIQSCTKNDTYAEINTELRSEMKEIREGIQMEMSEQLTDKWKQQYRRSHI